MNEANDSSPPSIPAAAAPPSHEELQHALKAFKKRIKLTRLDQESHLGGNRPTTTGRQSAVVAIIPPREIPRGVWDELVKQGKLKSTGGGFYQLVGG